MLSLIFLILLIIVGLLVVQLGYKPYSSKLLWKLPTPPTVPFFGNALTVHDSPEGLWKTIREFLHLPITCVWILSTPIVLLRHPDDIQVLIKSKRNIDKADHFYNDAIKAGSSGIFTSSGEKWRERRKIMNHAFSHVTFASFAQYANKHAQLLIQQLGCKNESVENTLLFCKKFALNTVCAATTDVDLNTVDSPDEEIFINAFKNYLKIIIFRCTRPYLTDWVFKFLPLGREQLKFKNHLNSFITRIIEIRQNYHKSNGTDLLSVDFTSEFDNNTNTEHAEEKSKKILNLLDILLIYREKGLIDDIAILEELETILGAGFDTTSITAVFTLLLLAEHENEQNLARKEVIDVMKNCDNKLTISDLENLKYVERCIKESLRLFATGAMIGRKLVEDTKFSKYVIPHGTDVFMCIYDLHRDPNFWPEPNKFNPDRFLPELTKNHHPYAYLPFSRGPRGCIGQKHAFIELKILIAHILYNFYLKPVDFSQNVQFEMNATLTPTSDEIRMKFIKICQCN